MIIYVLCCTETNWGSNNHVHLIIIFIHIIFSILCFYFVFFFFMQTNLTDDIMFPVLTFWWQMTAEQEQQPLNTEQQMRLMRWKFNVSVISNKQRFGDSSCVMLIYGWRWGGVLMMVDRGFFIVLDYFYMLMIQLF